jgi:hypothetical protein
MLKFASLAWLYRDSLVLVDHCEAGTVGNREVSPQFHLTFGLPVNRPALISFNAK